MLFDYFKDISFAQPWVFCLLLLLPAIVYWYLRKQREMKSSVTVSVLQPGALRSWRSTFRHLPFILRMLSFICIIIGMAGPQKKNVEQLAEGEGIDIVLAIDVSGSMTAQDFSPNRMEAAKNVAIDFISKRPTDRIGVVIFSGESFTQCPLTTDKNVLIASIKNIRNGLLEDGTAIGSGLATSVDRLRSSNAKSKIVLLLTDGENNGGLIDPKTAKEIAKTFGVKVYTIGVGSDGYARQPVSTPMGVVIQNEKVSIDEKLLTEIATETGGKYYRAKDDEGLKDIYSNIDLLEKSKVSISKLVSYENRFLPFILFALFLLAIELIIQFTILRKFP